jgi:hypothetical protein
MLFCRNPCGIVCRSKTLHYLGLSQLADGPMLDALEGVCDVLVTCNRALVDQNQIGGRSFAVIVLCAVSNTLPDLVGLVPEVLMIVPSLTGGDVHHIRNPKP